MELHVRRLVALAALLVPMLFAALHGGAEPTPEPAKEAPAVKNCSLKVVATVPAESGKVYLTGNLPELGPWEAASLLMTGEGTRREATVTVPCGTTVEFKLTRGDWEHEALDERGGMAGNHVAKVESDMEQAVVVTAFRQLYAEEFAAEMKPPAYDGVPLVVLSPRPWQVIQRRTEAQGDVLLSGRVQAPCDQLKVRIAGTNYKSAPVASEIVVVTGRDGSFRKLIPVPAGGWYKLEAEALKDGKVVASAKVDRFGVGEVFVGAGQSNSTNSGQYRIQQTSGMVSSFSGTYWRPANDPQPGCHDASIGGSFWPAFGDAMYARFTVPIGVAPTGHGGTSTTQWNPGGELHNWMMTRIGQLGPGGFRAILWHQGESDWAMETEEYHRRMKEIVIGTRLAAGWEVPWFNAHATYHNTEHPQWPKIRAAQEQLWKEGLTLEGPDTDTLQVPSRDLGGAGIHFNPEGLKAHGELWAEKVGAWLDGELKR